MIMDKEILINEMKEIFHQVPYGIEHTLRVLGYAEEIMDGENVNEYQREISSIVAIFHDIGAIEAQRKYGSMEGTYQEKEGPPIARRILEELGCDSRIIDRCCFIIGNHHTPARIDGIDFQIQWEADLIDNLKYTDIQMDRETLGRYIDDNFKTGTAKKIAYRELMDKASEDIH
ncbi:UTP:GlnB (Protein PII) uridylyltransferase [uncultured Sporomusa sp.]|uniref:UTP:GlnB (Protein PII) uridylyltransferase n=1 Tax=uncultured Sporomusa sp. TaxID=307249 RepID=A0A212LYU9_9FIRM|nr:HD domain-containing protein [uncultured Sporomusa sp.]SCM82627.1 UTP:GlnB (Protein PII) uridylyltransferase [uncultured Sporomusa sp.]